jgi:NADH dehydrogenase
MFPLSLISIRCVFPARTFSSLSVPKRRVVILGSGWAGFRLASELDKYLYDVTVISPRNHFLFTPMLPSTAVGTLEFRAIQEPVRTIPGLHHYYQAKARSIDFSAQQISCQCIFGGGASNTQAEYIVPYDELVFAVGSKSNTFGIQGVGEGAGHPHVYFLKDLQHARSIRNRIIECFERACVPSADTELVDRLLTFVIVGGGPTCVEFAAELSDFLQADVSRWYPELRHRIKVILIEASDHILGSFDQSLIQYVERSISKRNIRIMTGSHVKAVHSNSRVELKDGTFIPFGMVVWSTGVKSRKLTEAMIGAAGLPAVRGRLAIDSYLRIPGFPNVYAMGDCAINPEKPLLQLAQVANQQAGYLAKRFNSKVQSSGKGSEFVFTNMGSMAAIGNYEAVVDMSKVPGNFPGLKNSKGPTWKGLLAFLTWRGVYWSKTLSWKNRL